MTRMAVRLAFVAFMWALVPTAARSCVLDIDLVNSPAWSGGAGRGYDVFDPKSYYQPVALRVRSLEAGCVFYVTASAGTVGSEGRLSAGADTLRFTVFRDATGTQPLQGAALATQADILAGQLTKTGDSADFQIAYGIAPQQVTPPGAYAGQITVTAYEGALGSGKLLAQRTIPLTVTVPGVAETSFADGIFDPNQGVVSLNFGLMHQGDIKGVSLRTRSNGGYRVLAHSVNGGAMRRTDPADASTVQYRMTVDGKTVPLGTSDIEVAQRVEATDSVGKSHRVDFEIGSIAGASAGDYWDIVQVTIISLR